MTYIPEKIIRVPIDGMVDVSDYIPIIDSPAFQRLTGVKQLDVADVVYPGAKHTRFEHSLGTMEKFRKLFIKRENSNSDLTMDELKRVELVSLLHDDPHLPYGHLTEVIEQALTGRSHDDRWLDTVEPRYEEPLRECGFSVEDLRKVIETNLREIIWDIIGVDKLDYLQRDLYHIGFQRPDIEPQKKYTIFLKNRGLCIEEKDKIMVTSFIHNWYTAHNEIYWNKPSLIVATMMRRAIWDAISQGYLELEEMRDMRDWEVKTALKSSSGRARQLFKRILDRRMFKAAIAFRMSGYENFERVKGKPLTVVGIPEEQVNDFVIENIDFKKILELESELSKELNADVMISTTPQPERLKPKDPKVYSIDRDEIRKLSDINPDLFEYLQRMPKNMWAARILVPIEERKRVSGEVKMVKEYLLE